MAYDVVIAPSAVTGISALLREHAPAARYAVITDATVARLHGSAVTGALCDAGLNAELFEFPAGEAHKTRATWAALTDALLAHGIGRDACVVALGGGVAVDVGGFVAATYMRGVPCVQVPTSLLAMIDASIGGKTGVDAPAGKNLVGAFHPPALVIIDPLLLRTLPEDELRAGFAEAVKHGAVADADYFRWIEAASAALLGRDPVALAALIRRSVEIKAAVVARDPDERGERAILNFGHTLGHALERVLRYTVPHGHAVAVGMRFAAELGEHMGVTEQGTAAGIASVLGRFALPLHLPGGVVAEELIAAAAMDKKVRAGVLRFTLLRRIGTPARAANGEWTVPVEASLLAAMLESARASTGD